MQCPNCHTLNQPGHRFCGECGTPLPAPRTNPLPQRRGERRQVTVLLADIAGFTALSETLDPEQVTNFVNECFTLLVPIVQEYGGQVDTYLGDALLALFGTPIAHEDDPARAVRCALELCRRFDAWLADKRDLLGPSVGLHIGLNTGLAVTGQSEGSPAARQFSVMGEVVNIAAKVGSVATAGQVAVSESTYRFTAPLFRFAEMGSTEVKGRNQPVRVYRAIAPLSESNQVRGLSGLVAPLIGRDVEFAQLRLLIERVTERGDVAAIFGDAGIGKSRLLAELRSLVQSESAARWVEGRCLSYGQPLPYAAWREIIAQVCDLPAQDAAALQSQLQSALADLLEEPESAYPGLARLLGIGNASEADDAQVISATQTLLHTVAHRQPTIIAIDDLHWADDASLKLLNAVIAAPVAGLLIIGCARPDSSNGADVLRQSVADAHGLTITLAPLSISDSSSLVAALLRVEGMPARLRQLILERAEGIPFYVEEVVRSLIDSGTIYAEAGVWQVRDEAASLDVPPTLVGVITARVDTLEPSARHLLQVAAVLGRRFTTPALTATLAAELSDNALAAALVTLQQREMLRFVGPDEFSFKHILTQEVAYSTLLLTERRQYHHAAADYFAARPLPPQPAALADLRSLFDAHYHYVRAEDYPAALALTNLIVVQRPALTLSLDEALERWGENTARRPLYTALAPYLWGSDGASAWGRLGKANEQLGNLTAALEAYQHAIQIADEYGDRAALGTWTGQMGITHLMVGNALAALDSYERALQVANELGDRHAQARWVNAKGNAHRVMGMGEAAITDYQVALCIARDIGNRRSEGVQLVNLGLAYSTISQPQQAIPSLEAGLAILREVDDRRSEGMTLGSLAIAYSDLGDRDHANSYYDQAIALAEQMNDRHSLATWTINKYTAFALCADFVTYTAALHRALTYADGTGSQGLQSEIYAGFGYAALMQGDAAAALTHYQHALAIAETVEQPEITTIARNGLARTAAALGDRDHAIALLATDIPRNLLTREYLAICLYNIAQTLTLLGRPTEATDYLAQAIALNPCYAMPNP